MGILDNINGRSPFLRNTQNTFGQVPPAPQPPQMLQPQMPQMPQQQQVPQQQQANGIDPSVILKIMSMFAGGM